MVELLTVAHGLEGMACLLRGHVLDAAIKGPLPEICSCFCSLECGLEVVDPKAGGSKRDDGNANAHESLPSKHDFPFQEKK